MDIKKFNPNNIDNKILPLFIFIDDLHSLFGFGIRLHTKGIYSHVAEMVRKEHVVSQDFLYHEVSLEKYLKPQYRLKFIKYIPITKEQKLHWINLVSQELKEPWYKRRYDYIGVLIGHLFCMRWIQNPWLRYCSERIAEHMRKVFHSGIRKYPTPSEINQFMKDDGDFSVVGRWWHD